jgi:DUF4097 and DUF4098 domain-containing protein YvlB
MPVFATPAPISATIDLYSAVVQIVATDRADTVVEVRPSNESDDSDVKAAQQTRVEYSDGTLTVRGPKNLTLGFSKRTRSVDVLIELPTGSQVHGDLSAGDVRSTGVLDECRLKSGAGRFHLDRTGRLHLDTTGSGRVRIGEIRGTAVVKNSNGTTDIGTATGGLRVRSANGDITVDRAEAGVDAKTSNGSIRIATVVRDSVTLRTATGDLDVGVAAGTAAWLDLQTGYGQVRNELESIGQGPEKSELAVEVRAHTSFGDITVRRS